MKQAVVIFTVCALVGSIAAPAYATAPKGADRFANTEPLETISRSRTDAAEAAAQVPGAAGVLLGAAALPSSSACRPSCGAPIS